MKLTLLSNYNPKELIFSRAFRYAFSKKSFDEKASMNIGEAVRERIIELCRENDISINKLCTMSGVTQSTVNNIVSGRNNSATVSTIKKLCDGLGISIEDFFHSELFRNLEQEVK